MVRKWFLSSLLVIFTFSMAYAAGDPFQFAKSKTEEVISIVANKKLPEATKKQKIENIIDEIIYWDYVSRSVLGVHYRGLSKEDYKEFVDKFRRYIKSTYARKFIRYNGEKVEFTKDERQGDLAKIYANIITNDGKRIPVIAVVKEVGDKWLITDIYIEGVSMVANYRSQIHNVITQKGFRALLDMLDKKA